MAFIFRKSEVGSLLSEQKTSTIKVLSLKKNPLNIQKCLLPSTYSLTEYCGQYCFVTVNNRRYIVKLGLAELDVLNTVLLDESVSSLVSSKETETLKKERGININNFVIVHQPPCCATEVKVVVVFLDFLDLKRCKNSQNITEILKDILKLFVICKDSRVFLSNLLESQKFGINIIIIREVIGSNEGSVKFSNVIFRVDSSTVIKIEKCLTQRVFEQCQEKGNQVQVRGCNRVYNILKNYLIFCQSVNKSKMKLFNRLLLIGPSGCGKTTLVHNVVSDCKYTLLKVLPCNINSLSSRMLEQKLRSVFEEAKVYAEDKECCVILIEDIDLMSSRKTLPGIKFTELLITLLEEIYNVPGIVVIATTNFPDEVDLRLRQAKRLEEELEIMIPTAAERLEILEQILFQCKIALTKDIKDVLQQVSDWTPGFVGGDLRLLVVEALLKYRKKGSINVIDPEILKECFKESLTKVIPVSLKGATGLHTSNITFSEIGGLEDIKRVLDFSVKQQLENPGRFQNLGIPLTKGILLYGPPGCAKTTLVRALANDCNATFLATSAADLYSPFVGDAEKKIVQIFNQARLGSPSIVFIDEIDSVVGSKSGDRQRGVQERVLSTLLIEMDGVGLKVATIKDNSLNLLDDEEKKKQTTDTSSGVIVIGATNRPDSLDDALKRPGRFDRLLYVPPPNASERFRILKKLTEKMQLDESVDLLQLAKLTDFYSGADLKNLCQEAGLLALKDTDMAANKIHLSHFMYILQRYKPSLNYEVIRPHEEFSRNVSL